MSVRCFVCGREFSSGEKIVSVVRGKFEKAPGKTWGVSHDDCFDRAVDAPAVVMERVRKLAARKPKKPAANGG